MRPARRNREPARTATRRVHRPRRAVDATLVLVFVTVGLSACLASPASIAKVSYVSSKTVDGWKYDLYRNTAYPCSISGYQTFAIGTKVGGPTHASSRPLWVKMRGGGAGWFDSKGKPQPSAGVKSESSLDELLSFDSAGLMADVKAAPEGFRTLIVSMCSHDVYGGDNTPDPHNPNKTPDGKLRPTTGLVATKAAIQYTMAHYATSDYILQGTSAGSAGSFGVAWALQQQGIPPTAFIADSGNIDLQWEHDVVAQGITQGDCSQNSPERAAGVIGRVSPELASPDAQSDLLISSGKLTVPVAHVWNHGDQNVCGDVSMTCTLRNGSKVTLTAADCHHENLRRAIAAEGAGSRSINVPVCVEGTVKDQACDRHVVTAGTPHAVNTDTTHGIPADYQAYLLTWVRARLADDTP